MLRSFSGKCSIYPYNEQTKHWDDTGLTKGILQLYHNSASTETSIMWSKNRGNDPKHFIWTLSPRKIKPHGQRAVALKAFSTSSNKFQILAVRFKTIEELNGFQAEYNKLFPPSSDSNAAVILSISPSNPAPQMSTESTAENFAAATELTWHCDGCNWDNYIWHKQCNICHQEAEKKELEVNIDSIYTETDESAVDKANYINMVHSPKKNLWNAKLIIDRICLFQKRDEDKVTRKMKETEQKMINYCNEYQIIPSDVIYLCTAFYVNVKCFISSDSYQWYIRHQIYSIRGRYYWILCYIISLKKLQ